jgi:multicomponent Na+:H+ antiporter subunit G
MMEQILYIASWILLVGGSIFTLIGVIGMLRLPDMFARMHGASLIDTMGVLLILAGLALQSGWTIVTVKLVLIVIFIFYTSPTATHALAQAALWGGLKPESVEQEPEGEDR